MKDFLKRIGGGLLLFVLCYGAPFLLGLAAFVPLFAVGFPWWVCILIGTAFLVFSKISGPFQIVAWVYAAFDMVKYPKEHWVNVLFWVVFALYFGLTALVYIFAAISKSSNK